MLDMLWKCICAPGGGWLVGRRGGASPGAACRPRALKGEGDPGVSGATATLPKGDGGTSRAWEDGLAIGCKTTDEVVGWIKRMEPNGEAAGSPRITSGARLASLRLSCSCSIAFSF